MRIHDLAGRPRGAGFAADEHGTIITSHEAVDGLARVVLHAPGERTCVVHAADVVALPDAGLALIRTEGLGLRPLPVTVRDSVPRGSYVRIDACGWREARVLGSAAVTYTATDRFHLVGAALELAIGTDGADALRLGGGAAGGPVVDAASGVVVAVLGTALLPQCPDPAPPGQVQDPCTHRPAGYAVALRDAAAADPAGPLAALLARNAATVPAYGGDLNLAGALHLTATSSGCDGPPAPLHEPVERPDVTGEFAAFATGSARVLGLVGDPGTGRTTELAALAGRRADGPEPAPTLWLRGADLCGTDGSVADAVERALERAGRILEAAGEAPAGDLGNGLGDVSAGRVARLVRDAGRPLLLLLDGPEEMPPALAHRLARWSEGTEGWLRETGARLVVACRAEYWEQAGAHFDAGSLHAAGGGGGAGLPGCVRLAGLPEPQASRARTRYGIPEDALSDADARHPLALRLLSEVRAALPDAPPPGTPDRVEIFEAHLDLLCLRIAVRLAAANGLRGSAVRRLAAVVSGQVHEAARRCLGPGQGGLDTAAFEEVFPWGAPLAERSGMEFSGCTGWASAVLTEGLLVPAGTGYRFAHEEPADWLQGMHLDVDGALMSLVHRHRHRPGAVARPASVSDRGDPTPTAPRPRPLPVPRHRIGPVIQALLLLGRQRGAAELASRLLELADAWEECAGAGQPESGAGELPGDAAWWAARLLGEVLLRVPDASPYLAVLEPLAERGEFGVSFWLRLPLGDADRFALLRRLVVRDGPPGAAGRCLDAVAELLTADPAAVQPHLVRWFADEHPLLAAPHATVASAAQALLHTHRHRAIDNLIETLVDCGGACGEGVGEGVGVPGGRAGRVGQAGTCADVPGGRVGACADVSGLPSGVLADGAGIRGGLLAGGVEAGAGAGAGVLAEGVGGGFLAGRVDGGAGVLDDGAGGGVRADRAGAGAGAGVSTDGTEGGVEVIRVDTPQGSAEARAEALADALADHVQRVPGCADPCADASADRADTVVDDRAGLREGNPAAGAEPHADDPGARTDVPASRVDIRTGSDAVTARGGVRAAPSAGRADARASLDPSAGRADARASLDPSAGRVDARASTCADTPADRVGTRTESAAPCTDAVTGRDGIRVAPSAGRADEWDSSAPSAEPVDARASLDPSAEPVDARASTCADASADRVDIRTGSRSTAAHADATGTGTDAVTGRDGVRVDSSAERADASASPDPSAGRADSPAFIDPSAEPDDARASTCADASVERADARASIDPSAEPADTRAHAPVDRADPPTARATPRTAIPLTAPSTPSRTRIAARADELLAALVEEEPSAVCRAVARWARDERGCRRLAAALYGPRVAPYVADGPARDLLRHAAFALLARGDDVLHGAALALLVHDPRTRSRHLPHALSRFAAGDPLLPATAPAAALPTHPEPVLDAFRTRLLHVPGPVTDEILCALADVTAPALAHRVAALVHDLLERRPEAAGPAAAYVDRRLDHGSAVRSALFPLVTGLLHSSPARVRAALAPVLAAPGTPASRGLRGELFDVLLGQERDPDVLESALRAVARAAGEYDDDRTRERVHRIGQLLVRTPEGATRFDRSLVEAARDNPRFAARVVAWLGAAPDAWAALVGPSAGRTIERLARGVRVPAQAPPRPRPVDRAGVTPATCSGASRDPSAWQS
ncbi:hypothetical protein ABZS76_20860 [Streptomyces sp. NPDC005562]|uniref:hypothetical protein n=1 Tax=Streptomyces sp. NPDC005562 TaxID=3154890 RepID=UPI0033AD8E90